MKSANEQADEMEVRIVEAAKDLFTERGFVETSMGDIAARVGVNRPAINYYFRTKERLFEASLGSIVRTYAPHVVWVILQQDRSVSERVELLVGLYFRVFAEHPSLPFFMLREVNRNCPLLLKTIAGLGLLENVREVGASLDAEMASGRVRRMSMRVMLLTFVSLITMPFNVRPLIENALIDDTEDFSVFLQEWRSNIVELITHMLTPQVTVDR